MYISIVLMWREELVGAPEHKPLACGGGGLVESGASAMHDLVPLLLSAGCSYLIGSIPFGYLMGLVHGVDIRTVGSGNIGATNVFRTLGRGPGVLTFALDVAKGVAAGGVVPFAVGLLAGTGAPALGGQIACGVAVLLGHAFPLFLGFRGGKGVATGLGVACGLVPHSALLGVAVWVVVFLATRYVSVGSICAALTVAVAPWFLELPPNPGAGRVALCAVVSVLAVGVALKHHSNVRRLLAGTENRFCFTKRQLEERDRRKGLEV